MSDSKLKRKAVIQWVPLEQMKVRTGISQRPFRQEWADAIAKEFDLDRFRRPVVNRVDDWFWIIDGQHSTDGYKQWLGDWEGQKVECEVYHGLSEKEEANLFDWLNNTKQVAAYDRFAIRATAGREVEVNISAIVSLHGIKIARHRSPGTMNCVSALRRVFEKGPECLDETLRISYKGFGEPGLDSDLIFGISQLVSRYNGRLNASRAIAAFAGLRGGANALRSRAERLRQQTGASRNQCIAAAAVEVINRGRGGKKLPAWWKASE